MIYSQICFERQLSNQGIGGLLDRWSLIADLSYADTVESQLFETVGII